MFFDLQTLQPKNPKNLLSFGVELSISGLQRPSDDFNSVPHNYFGIAGVGSRLGLRSGLGFSWMICGREFL